MRFLRWTLEVVAPHKKEIKKKKENKDENKLGINNYKVEECLDILEQKLENNVKIILKDNINCNKLMNKLLEIEFYYKNNKKDKKKLSEINSILSLLKEGKSITINEVNKLYSLGIDIYLDLYSYDKNIISLEKINNLGKIIFSLQKLPNSLTLLNLMQSRSIFSSKEILK